MKKPLLLSSVWLGIWLLSSVPILTWAQSGRLQNVEAVTDAGEYSNPVWSPDGTQLLFTEAHNEKLFVLNLEGDRRVDKLAEGAGIGYLAAWSANGQQVLYRERDTDTPALRVKSIDLATGQQTSLTDVHPDNLRSASTSARTSDSPLIVYINLETLKLEAKRGLDGTPWVITPEAGQFY